jgi:hypothetical protein
VTVWFYLLDPLEGREAYRWHRGYVASDNHLFPRTWPAYERMASNGQVWCAKDSNNDYLALAYSTIEDDAWEIGGLMVAVQEKEKGIGSIIARLTLGHLLFEEDPLGNGKRVIAHVHAQNNAPRKLLEGALKFKKTATVLIPGSELPGLMTNSNGDVEGDVLSLVSSDTLLDLADWCRNWKGKLKDNRKAQIDFRDGISLQIWANAFDDMASRWH